MPCAALEFKTVLSTLKMSQMTEATNPFSEDVDNRWEPGTVFCPAKRVTCWNSPNDHVFVSNIDRSSVPLYKPDTEGPGYRILTSSQNPESLRTTGDKWVTVYRKPLAGRSSATVRCMAVSQRYRSAKCEIRSPVQCDLWYDATADPIRVMNLSEAPLQLRSQIPPGAAVAEPETYIIGQYGTATISPGLWICVSDASRTLQIQVFPRKYTISLVHRNPPEEHSRAGLKRPLSSLCRPAASLEVTRSLNSLEEMLDGETVRARSSSGDFLLSRIKSTSDTKAARLFKASHSSYPGRAIVVKVLRSKPGKSAESRVVAAWNREYLAHSQLKCVSGPGSASDSLLIRSRNIS